MCWWIVLFILYLLPAVCKSLVEMLVNQKEHALRGTNFVSGSHTFFYFLMSCLLRTWKLVVRPVGDGGAMGWWWWLVRLRNDRAISEHPAGRDWAEVKPEGVEADV